MNREEVQRMADAWKANDARNKKLKAVEAASLLGENPLPSSSQYLLWNLLEDIEKHHDLPDGVTITLLYWQYSSELARAYRIKNANKI